MQNKRDFYNIPHVIVPNVPNNSTENNGSGEKRKY